MDLVLEYPFVSYFIVMFVISTVLVLVRIPTMATPRSDAWRPPIPIDGDQGGVRAPLGEVGHLSVVT